jgi:predicted small integral membrane protein
MSASEVKPAPERLNALMIETRIVKTVMVAALACFALLVAFNNIVDYNTNYEFVRHTLSMDTTFPGNALMHRAIVNPALWTIGYWAIILGEGMTGIAFAVATTRLLVRLRARGAVFDRAKRFVAVGGGIGFLVWFFGFMVIGGEWFAMWQSPQWNGQQAAFRFYMAILAVLIFTLQPDGDFER